LKRERVKIKSSNITYVILLHPEVSIQLCNLIQKNYSTKNENIPLISDHVPTHKKPVSDEEFSSYLAGLIEGDGSFSKHGHTVKITFHINDAPLAYYIKKRIGYSHSLKCSSLNIRRPFSSIEQNTINKHKKNINRNSLNSWWITGFADAEGSFYISITKNSKYSSGYCVQVYFHLHLHNKDLALLSNIQASLGVGKIYKDGLFYSNYQVSSIKDLSVIIDHFALYPLITHKLSDYLLFKQAVELIKRGEHLTIEGLNKIVAIKASMNNGLPDELKKAFPNVKAIQRPRVTDQKIKDPHWLAGFVDGEGCFFVSLMGSSTHKLGSRVQLRFLITQHIRDEQLIKSLVNYLSCGKIYKGSKRDVVDFVVTRFTDLSGKIIPLFDLYPLQSSKAKDLADFKKVLELMKNKAHLTQEGLDEIKQIKSGMNTGR
jgi:hypothetical protein